MRKLFVIFSAAATLVAAAQPWRLVIVDPGHFHATLIQREMYPELAPRVSVFAPLGPELLDYLNRIALFNSRRDNPTHWQLDVHTSADPMAEMLRARAGDIGVFTGRNRGKIDRIQASLTAGMHVLADKPWIIHSSEMPKLEKALDDAQRRHLAAYDIMTERYDIAMQLQRAFVSDAAVFGKPQHVEAKSIHHILKTVAGVPLRRPTWFFDISEYGEALADVGTHVVDIVQWTLFPEQNLDYRADVRVQSGRHWPTRVTKAQYQQITGESRPDDLDFFCNNSVEYTLRGIPVKMDILWNVEAPGGGGDIYVSTFQGSSARVEARDGEVYLSPANSQARDAVRRRIAALQQTWPGLAAEDKGAEIRLKVPDKYRLGHEAHFAEVTRHFFAYVKNPASMPSWERSYMLAKYYVSTKGVELANK